MRCFGTIFQIEKDAGAQDDRSHESRDRSRPMCCRIPQAQIVNHSGKESGFSYSEKESQEVEGSRSPHEHQAGGDQAPRYHDSRDPKPGSNSFKDDIAWYLKQAITKKENTRAETKHCRAKPEIRVHLQSRETHVHSVQPCDDVKHKEKWDQSPCHFAQGDHRQLVGTRRPEDVRNQIRLFARVFHTSHSLDHRCHNERGRTLLAISRCFQLQIASTKQTKLCR